MMQIFFMSRTRCLSFCLLPNMDQMYRLNHSYDHDIKNNSFQALAGSAHVISPLLRFIFWNPSFFLDEDPAFGSESTKERGRVTDTAKN